MQIPVSNLRPDRFHRLVRDCWTEVDEVLPLAILRSSWPKCIAQKIKLLVRIGPPPVIILAIDHLRLLRMKFEPTFLHSCGDCCPNLLGLLLRSAVHDGIISETL